MARLKLVPPAPRRVGRWATPAMVAATTVALAGCGWPSPAANPSGETSSQATAWNSPLKPPDSTSTTSGDEPADCAQLASAMTLDQKVGQLYLIGLDADIEPKTIALLQETQAGAVILTGTRDQGVAYLRDYTDELVEAAGPAAALIVAAD